MGIACNATWQESDSDACLQVRTGGANSQQAINVIEYPSPYALLWGSCLLGIKIEIQQRYSLPKIPSKKPDAYNFIIVQLLH